MKPGMRVCAGEADFQEMAALVDALPSSNLHVADLPYRLSSWALDAPENVGLWVDENGVLFGWAVMQIPFWTIDYALHPHAATTLHPQILAWADERARQIVDTPSGRPMWFANVFTDQQDRIHDLEAAGFASQANVGENSWTKVLMRRAGQTPIKSRTAPDGFTIRPLAGMHEVAAYVELHQATFQSKNMTIAWRQRTLERPEYVADLDLVAVAPDGRLAAFCIGWLDRKSTGGVRGQIEPLGVHEEFRNRGLGHCILSEGLRLLQQHGADSLYVETDNYRDEAFALYESMGFLVAHDVLVYRKDYGA